MNVRVRSGPNQWRALEGAPVRTGCPFLLSVSVPSSHIALTVSFRLRLPSPMVLRGAPGLASSQHGPSSTRHAIGQRNGNHLERLGCNEASEPVGPRLGPLSR